MAKEKLAAFGFRLPLTVVERIDAYSEQLAATLPGHRVSRSDTIRVLLERALTIVEAEAPSTATKPKRK